MLWGSGGELVGVPRLVLYIYSLLGFPRLVLYIYSLLSFPRLVLYIYSLWILDLGICGECHFVRWQRRQTRSVSVHKKDEMLQFLETFGQSSVEAFWRFSHGFVVVSMGFVRFPRSFWIWCHFYTAKDKCVWERLRMSWRRRRM